MRVAKYWAGVQIQRVHVGLNRSIAQTIWGGSDISEQQALVTAQRRANELESIPIELGGGEGDHTPDSYVGYPGLSKPEPLIDDISDESGGRVGAVTINRYGADVLNTKHLVFIDIDDPQIYPTVGGLVRAITGLFTSKHAQINKTEPSSLDWILEEWAEHGAGRGARVYRTAGGRRVMLVRPPMQPTSRESSALMESFEADPLYINLCKVQECFRARLSPKPWRVGIDPIRVTYEMYRDNSRAFVDWMQRYHEVSARFSVCELVAEYGDTSPPDPACARMIELHDTACGVGIGLPLA